MSKCLFNAVQRSKYCLKLYCLYWKLPVTVREANLVSECNVVSAEYCYVPVPVTVPVTVRMADLVSECSQCCTFVCSCTCNVPVTVRIADLVSECNVVSAVHSYVPVPVTYL